MVYPYNRMCEIGRRYVNDHFTCEGHCEGCCRWVWKVYRYHKSKHKLRRQHIHALYRYARRFA